MAASDIQYEAMHVYRALVELREDWGGALVLLCGPGRAQSGAPAAVSIAGGTTLAIDSNAAAMKAAMRAGYLDFVVNSLDEALRALKNEVRKRRPLGVGLIADVDAIVAEMVERGVEPDLELVPAGCAGLMDGHDNAIGRAFSPRISLAEEPEASPQAGVERAFGLGTGSMLMRQVGSLSSFREGYSECFVSAASAAELAAVDVALLARIGADDLVRRRWVQRVPQYLREARTGGRWIWLSGEERDQLATDGSIREGQQAGP